MRYAKIKGYAATEKKLYRTVHCHIPEDSSLHSRLCMKLKIPKSFIGNMANNTTAPADGMD